jgi:DNA-directed RNA polymerase alpha subunit
LKYILIDQFRLTPKIYNCLNRLNIHTLWSILENSQEDLIEIKHFCIEDIKHTFDILKIEKHVTINLLKKNFKSNRFISKSFLNIKKMKMSFEYLTQSIYS